MKAIRTQGTADSQHPYNAAQSGYGAQTSTTTRMQGLVLGGGDTELAAMRVSSRDAAAGFSTTSSVGTAAANAHTQALKAVGFTRASNAASLWSTGTDSLKVKPYNAFRDRRTNKEGNL